MRKPELLAPAGDLERLKVALLYGADAVYCGGPTFGLRANAINFTLDELKEGVEFAHKLNKRVHVTVNIVLHNEDLIGLEEYLKELDKIGVDAIIVSDPAVISLAQKYTNLEIHLSTQQSTINTEAVNFWKNQGVKRVVLGRECRCEDIDKIIKENDIEIETFIHGAMCAGYSGRCVLSNLLTDRDANRGGCSQICRWNFNLMSEDLKHLEGDKEFTFCSKDLSLLRYIPSMIDMGIASFKIEGRMRSTYYIATVVSIYRKVIDEYCNETKNYEYNSQYEIELNACANRDSIPQFFDGNYGSNCSYYNGRMEISNQDFLGTVIDYDATTHLATIEQRNYFSKGDTVEIFSPFHPTITITIDNIIDEIGNNIDIVRHPKQIVKIYIPYELYVYDMMRIKRVDK